MHRPARDVAQWLANRVNRIRGRHDRLVDESTWHPQDRRVARWYGPLMVAGYTAAVVMAVFVAVPLAWHLFGGAARALWSDDSPSTDLWDASVLFILSGAHVALAGYLAWRDRRRPPTGPPRSDHLGASRTMTTPRHTCYIGESYAGDERIATACLDRRPSPTPRPVHRWPVARLLVPVALQRWPDLVRRHDIELVTVAPELDALISCHRQTLTSSATAEERTRFYPRPAPRRVAHGLVDFLNEHVATRPRVRRSSSPGSTKPTRRTPNGWRSCCVASTRTCCD